MTLDKLKKGDVGTITNITCDSTLKNRFYSLGITKGSTVEVEEMTLARNTIKIKMNSTKIALRVAEASKIEVTYG